MKKKMIRFAILLFFLVSVEGLLAQVQIERSTEIVKVGQEMYYMHHVKKGETLYGLAKAYNVTVEEIVARNPEIATGLQVDMVIGITVKDETTQEAFNTDSGDDLRKHTVLKGETLYSLSHQYDVTMDQIIGLNPGVEKGLREGQTLIIPSAKVEQTLQQGNEEYVVKSGETIYTIAKKFRMDISVLKAANPGLTEKLWVGQKIKIPAIQNDDSYLVHLVDDSQKTSSLLKKWEVSEDEFRAINPAVGVRVFSGQNVLIPIEPKVSHTTEISQPVVVPEPEPTIDTVTVEPEPIPENPEPLVSECEGSIDNAGVMYHVALLVPLYLDEVGNIGISPEKMETAKKSRAFSFLQYYEGFMLAVDSLTQHYGLKLDLSVIDVDENVPKARKAVESLRKKPVDLIVGPFFSKAFDEVERYAKEKNIPIVNPFSTRESIIEQNANVIKLKPSSNAQAAMVGNLIQNYFPDSKVSFFTMNSSIERHLSAGLYSAVKHSTSPEVKISNAKFVDFIRSESRRRGMGKKVLSSVEVENRMFSTDLLQSRLNDSTLFENPVYHYSYSTDSLKLFKNELSTLRNNLVVAYGNDVVFATEMLNNLNKSVEQYPITLIGLPQWSEFEKLFVDNLLKMNAIYFDDYFVNYNDQKTKQFIISFRHSFVVEPNQYAFQGFDVAWYFLNVLQRYGTDFMSCLPYYHIPLLHTQYYFKQCENSLGLENHFWNIYQYDSKRVELTPLDASCFFKEY